MFSPASSIIADTPQLYLAISEESLERFWQQQPSPFSANGIRWMASLNQICLDALLPWIQEFHAPNAKVWKNPAALSSIWEVVNGSAIELDRQRLAIVPTAAADFDELRVPQEWVDLPSWVGDYYVSVYVNPDDREIRVLGYTTHHTLKQQGHYDACDRTYSLESDSLIGDFNVLWTTRQLCANEVRQAVTAPLPVLSQTQADSLINRLGVPSILTPRLAIPFQQWGALLEHDGWRQRLYERRLGLPDAWSVQQWLQAGISDLAQQFGWGTMNLQPNLARGANGAARVLVRQLMIAGKPYELCIFQQSEEVWCFKLQTASIGGLIPGGFKLRLLTEDLMPFENNEDIANSAIEQIYLEVRLSPGDTLIWEIEPLPDNYTREILRF